jgi:hypothetical protein
VKIIHVAMADNHREKGVGDERKGEMTKETESGAAFANS